MDLRRAEELALELMTKHGLRHSSFAVPGGAWKFRFDGARKRYGCCDYGARTISLSRHLTAINPEEQVRDTILHEIAHALVPSRHGHDRVWRRMAISIGCSGIRCAVGAEKLQTGGYVGKCPGNHPHRKFRRVRVQYACRHCTEAAGKRGFHPEFLIVWRKSPGRLTIASES